MALATITARGLRLSARRATSIVPLASRASSPQFARLPQNLITGALATTPAKALSLSEIFGKSAEVDVHKTHFDEACALTPRVAAFQPTTAIEADTAIHTPQFWGFGVLSLRHQRRRAERLATRPPGPLPSRKARGGHARHDYQGGFGQTRVNLVFRPGVTACRRASLSPNPLLLRSILALEV